MLDEEAQSEQYREDRIHLSCKKEEYRVPYPGIDCRPEVALWLGEHEEVHLFLEVYKDYAGNGYSPEDIRHVNAGIRTGRCLVCVAHFDVVILSGKNNHTFYKWKIILFIVSLLTCFDASAYLILNEILKFALICKIKLHENTYS